MPQTTEEALLKIEDSLHKLKTSQTETTMKLELLAQDIKTRNDYEEKSRSESRIWIRSFIPALCTFTLLLGTLSCNNRSLAEAAMAKAESIDKVGTTYGRGKQDRNEDDVAKLRNEVATLSARTTVLETAPR